MAETTQDATVRLERDDRLRSILLLAREIGTAKEQTDNGEVSVRLVHSAFKLRAEAWNPDGSVRGVVTVDLESLLSRMAEFAVYGRPTDDGGVSNG